MSEHISLHRPSIPCARDVDALRRGVRALVADGDAKADDGLRSVARLMCDDARARGMQVEDLIVSLKRTWTAIAEAERIPRSESTRLLARAVTLCVEEFYAPMD
jgi:hypothetical protein